MLYLFSFVFGLITGSFLNICIDRLPNRQPIFTPLSCGRCQARLQAWDLIPFISYLKSSGQCRHCEMPIPLRKPVVELLTGLLFILCLNTFGFSEYIFKSLIFTSFMIVIAFIDWDHHLIFDNVLIWLAGFGVAINLFIGKIGLLEMLLAGLFGGGVFLLLALISKGGFGGGDVKFMAALGIWLGLKYTLLAFFLTFLLGGLGAAVLLALKIKGRKDNIAYGPYMALAAFLTLLYGNDIIAWYVQYFSR